MGGRRPSVQLLEKKLKKTMVRIGEEQAYRLIYVEAKLLTFVLRTKTTDGRDLSCH